MWFEKLVSMMFGWLVLSHGPGTQDKKLSRPFHGQSVLLSSFANASYEVEAHQVIKVKLKFD